MILLLALAFPPLITFLIYLVIAVLVLSIVYYVINKHAPEPIRGWAITIVIVIAAIFLIYFLLSLVGRGGSPF